VLETQTVKHKRTVTTADSVKADCSEIIADIKILNDHLQDIKTMLERSEERIRILERLGDKTTPVMIRRVEALEDTAKVHEKELEALQDLITKTAHSVDKLSDSFNDMQKIWKWALGIFTTILVAVLIMLLTGQAEVTFK
jgi:hypothetical protein